jgi:hypothetical protein
MSILWVAQNVALSGCLVYPVSFTCTSLVDWSVGSDSAKGMADIITAWARKPGPQYLSSLGNLDWLQNYYLSYQTFFENFLLLSLVIILFAIYIRFLTSRNQPISSCQLPFDGTSRMIHWTPLLVCLVGIAFCAVSAPHPRFAHGFFLLLPPSIAYLVLPKEQINEFCKQHALVKKRLFISVFLVAGILFLVFPPKSNNLENEFSDLNLSRSMTMKTTNSGVAIQTPVNSDQCGMARLPCTPYFNDFLSRESFLWLPMWKIQKRGK